MAAIGERGEFVLGHHVNALEREVAKFIGGEEGITVASGTDALVLALHALDIGPGDEVITTPFSFFATVEAILRVGATPVFADIEEHSFNLNPEEVARQLGPRTRAILPVHLFGRPADMDAIMELATQHGLKVVEDAAQAFGARIRDRGVGAFGDMGCFSFYPTKVLGCYGDGGMVIAKDPQQAKRLRSLRNHGLTAASGHQEIGYNSRLDELQAALLRIKLKHLDKAIEWRQNVAAFYDNELAGSELMFCSPVKKDLVHVHNVYTVRSPDRDALCRRLNAAGVGNAVYYPHPLHIMPACRSLGYEWGDFPVAEKACKQVLSLPIYPLLSDEELTKVCKIVRAESIV